MSRLYRLTCGQYVLQSENIRETHINNEAEYQTSLCFVEDTAALHQVAIHRFALMPIMSTYF